MNINIAFNNPEYTLISDSKEIISTKNPRRIMRETRDILEQHERDIRRGVKR